MRRGRDAAPERTLLGRAEQPHGRAAGSIRDPTEEPEPPLRRGACALGRLARPAAPVEQGQGQHYRRERSSPAPAQGAQGAAGAADRSGTEHNQPAGIPVRTRRGGGRVKWGRKRKKSKNRQIRVPGPPSEVAGRTRLRELANAIFAAKKAPPKAIKVDPRRALRQRIAELPALVEARVRSAATSATVTVDERMGLDRRLELGVSTVLPDVRGDLPLDAVLG